jgi:16S rRNA (guanine(1405)-N(7))-methyltransferase
MPTDHPTDLDRLVAQVQAGGKYRSITPALIRAIGARELTARRSLKEAVKATKNKLHQVAGAYLGERPDYNAWLAELRAAAAENGRRTAAGGADDPPPSILRRHSFRAACRRIMAHHASTRERLPILDTFYATTLAGLPPIRSVLDVACGLNPLALPWMPLTPGARYLACDIYADMVNFINQFFGIASVPGEAFICDLMAGPPAAPVDLALALKIIPPLEQLDRRAGATLLRGLHARHILVSFPAQSLGGRGKGMSANYERHFYALIEGTGWQAQRFAFPTELAFLIDTGSGVNLSGHEDTRNDDRPRCSVSSCG